MQQHLASQGIEARPEWAEVTHVREVRCARCRQPIPAATLCLRRTSFAPPTRHNETRHGGSHGFLTTYRHLAWGPADRGGPSKEE